MTRVSSTQTIGISFAYHTTNPRITTIAISAWSKSIRWRSHAICPTKSGIGITNSIYTEAGVLNYPVTSDITFTAQYRQLAITEPDEPEEPGEPNEPEEPAEPEGPFTVSFEKGSNGTMTPA